MAKTLVMKFGGAAVATPESFAAIASLIKARKQVYDLAVVVSAMQGTTDQLIALAHSIHPKPPQREYDMLVTVGERISASLLAMALTAQGCPASSFTGSQAGIITCERHTEARIVDVRPRRLCESLACGAVPVVAGFQGVSRHGDITTLGRGGSDTTAVALAIAFGAECVEFYKDVSGIFSADPKKDATSHHLPQLSYSAALALALKSGPVLHPRCIQLAQHNALPLYVRSFKEWHNPMATMTVIEDLLPPPLTPIYESSEFFGSSN